MRLLAGKPKDTFLGGFQRKAKPAVRSLASILPGLPAKEVLAPGLLRHFRQHLATAQSDESVELGPGSRRTPNWRNPTPTHIPSEQAKPVRQHTPDYCPPPWAAASGSFVGMVGSGLASFLMNKKFRISSPHSLDRMQDANCQDPKRKGCRTHIQTNT